MVVLGIIKTVIKSKRPMFKLKKIIGFIGILGLLFTLTPVLSFAQEIPSTPNTQSNQWLRFVNLRIAPSNTSAKIYWTTNFPTTGYFKFGLTNGFGNWSEDLKQDTYHETLLSNLKGETTYYFQITATDSIGRQIKSDIYDFKTLIEDDHIAPTISNPHINFISGNSVSISWETDEFSNSCIHYGLAPEKITSKGCKSSSRVKIHDLTVYGLKTDTLYYYQVSSTDKAGNIQYSVVRNFKTNYQNDSKAGDLVIYELSPFNRKTAGDLNKAIINIKTNRPVEGYISYGTKSKSYNKKVTLDWPRTTDTTVVLPDLVENQTYYYKIYLTDVLGKKITTPEFSFLTLAGNVLTEPNTVNFNALNDTQDYDRDGLTNEQETLYNTDPLKADTDGDSYLDGIEVAHCYNPLGPGRLATCGAIVNPTTTVTGPYYGQPRLKSLVVEQNLARELSQLLVPYKLKNKHQPTAHIGLLW
jgi:hypothetical protein